MNVNHFIQESVQMLRRMVKKKVRLQAVLADRDVRIMADWEKMSQVFATIVAYGSEIIQKKGTITILAKLLPIENDLLEKGTGRCALLSVSSTDVTVNRSGSGPGHKGRAGKSVRRAFSAIRSVIGGYNGSVRVSRQQGKAQFNIYLPVLDGT
jgi:peptidyl-tRNA hydrolase